MKVALYIDTDEPDQIACAKLCAASIRKNMPDVSIVHLNGGDNEIDIGADECVHEHIDGTFAKRRALMQSRLEGETLFLDTDIIVQADVSSVFAEAFHIAIATDIRPGAPSIKYNAGVVFCRNPEFYRDILSATEKMPFDDWREIETQYTKIADSGKYRLSVLDGNEYNYVPTFGAEDVSMRKIVHYRGKRKQWMLGKPGLFVPTSQLNNERDIMLEQFAENIKRDLPYFSGLPAHERVALIAGGGPSLQDTLPSLRLHQSRNGDIFALNAVHDYLIERCIIPDFHVMLDSRIENAEFVRKPHKDVSYLISAFCHPSVFDALEGHEVTLWMSDMDGVRPLVKDIHDKPVCLVGGGATVGMKTMFLAYLMGYRKLHFYGFDSSYRDKENHAYRQELNDSESRITIQAAGKSFTCSPWMAKQAQEFQSQVRKLMNLGCSVNVHGDGLVPWIMKQWEDKTDQPDKGA